ncbi:sigma-54 interaction domain-containing protein [Bacillus sp. SCS-153A]|uniref:sigma-54 interaction domain-containing protein n=1 Tax=Rossellomorea sedimentorum TaxID=3115294 RepID=UPI003905B3AF
MKSLLGNVSIDMIETILENAFEWLVVVDDTGRIIFMNQSYCDFLEVDREKAIGIHVTEVIENTRMHIVAQTGKEEIADLQYIRGNYMIANRIPIVVDGKVVGAFGSVFFRDTSEWKQMSSHVKNMLSKMQSYIQDINNGSKYTLTDICGRSRSMEELKQKVQTIAPSDISVLIRGESGTGKELFAHSIHHLSERSHQPFIKVNCAAIPEQLLESELFGYEEGAFTGARKGGKKGKFQLADKGTLFLDEVGDMPLNMQAKLLRVLQEGEVEPVGATETEQVDVRIIAATNRPLEKMIEEKRFREDLYYRINVIPFTVPPLRERVEDIPVLARKFMDKSAEKSGKRLKGLEPLVLEIFNRYSWPGNIRELENVIEASTYFTSDETITEASLPAYIKGDNLYKFDEKSLKEILEETEKKVITQTLKKHSDRRAAAKALGISKSSLYEKIKKLEIE